MALPDSSELRFRMLCRTIALELSLLQGAYMQCFMPVHWLVPMVACFQGQLLGLVRSFSISQLENWIKHHF